MGVRFSEEEIARMIAERKPLPKNCESRMQMREKRGHKERELDIIGMEGRQYRVILRQSNFNVLDFSVILAVVPSDSNQLFRLRRYNGKSHEHTNHIERETFYDFHIHHATERYQESGLREDAFAEPTTRYADLHGARHCLLADCGFEVPDDGQLELPGDFEI